MRSARLELSLQARKPPSCPAWCGPWPVLGAAMSNRRLTDHPPRRLHTVVSAQGVAADPSPLPGPDAWAHRPAAQAGSGERRAIHSLSRGGMWHPLASDPTPRAGILTFLHALHPCPVPSVNSGADSASTRKRERDGVPVGLGAPKGQLNREAAGRTLVLVHL